MGAADIDAILEGVARATDAQILVLTNDAQVAVRAGNAIRSLKARAAPDYEGKKLVVSDGALDQSERDGSPRWEVHVPHARTIASCHRRDDAEAIRDALNGESSLKQQIAAIIREPGGELLDKILRIGDLVGVPRPPRHVSPILECDDVA